MKTELTDTKAEEVSETTRGPSKKAIAERRRWEKLNELTQRPAAIQSLPKRKRDALRKRFEAFLDRIDEKKTDKFDECILESLLAEIYWTKFPCEYHEIEYWSDGVYGCRSCGSAYDDSPSR